MENQKTWYDFDGDDWCEDCRGWDGESGRCDCGNRRVTWECMGSNCDCGDSEDVSKCTCPHIYGY